MFTRGLNRLRSSATHVSIYSNLVQGALQLMNSLRLARSDISGSMGSGFRAIPQEETKEENI